jgi:hypothetical protein
VVDPSIFTSIAEYGVAIVALVAVSLFAFWIVRTWTTDLRAARDRALDISERQVTTNERQSAAIELLTAAVNRLSDRRRA